MAEANYRYGLQLNQSPDGFYSVTFGKYGLIGGGNGCSGRARIHVKDPREKLPALAKVSKDANAQNIYLKKLHKTSITNNAITFQAYAVQGSKTLTVTEFSKDKSTSSSYKTELSSSIQYYGFTDDGKSIGILTSDNEIIIKCVPKLKDQAKIRVKCKESCVLRGFSLKGKIAVNSHLELYGE